MNVLLKRIGQEGLRLDFLAGYGERPVPQGLHPLTVAMAVYATVCGFDCDCGRSHQDTQKDCPYHGNNSLSRLNANLALSVLSAATETSGGRGRTPGRRKDR